jgi:tetratricopeptide (TPR) repeat protein
MTERDADRTEAALEQAKQLFAEGRLSEAAAICADILARYPGHPGALRRVAFIQVVQNSFEAAARTLDELLPIFPDDPQIRLAQAETVWSTESPAAAIPHFRAVLDLAPEHPTARDRLGAALLADGRPAEAAIELERALPSSTTPVATLIELARARAQLGDAERAVEHLRAAYLQEPGNPDILFHLGATLRGAGLLERAVSALQEAVRLAPDNSVLRVALGDALRAHGDRAAALMELTRATELAPDWPVAWSALGDVLQHDGRREEAIASYRRALACHQTMPEIHTLLANALHDGGNVKAAAEEYAIGMKAARWAGGPGLSGDVIKVGAIAAPGSANTSTTFIVDRAFHAIEFIFLIEGYSYPADGIDRSYDILFNTASDPDISGSIFDEAVRLADRLTLPLLNPPRAILETTRERMAERLAGIDHCVMPETLRVARADVSVDLMEMPFLIRPIGSHGGDAIARIESEQALADYLATASAAEFYLTRFVDFRAGDGLYRKYRLIFVGGEILPYHLAIGEDWLVHYFRTGMARDEALRAEEARFLADPRTALGEAAWAALQEIAARVPLDYFGVDCSVLGNGDLLVFECNATMLVHDNDEQALFAYKKPATLAIRDAVTRLIAGRKR